MTPKVVALGGGHGLAASLSALRCVTDKITAVVTVSDDGGSSGRLREEFGVLPPGDLRKALAALCGDDEWGRTWADVLQYRFRGDGALRDHALGNLLIVGITELLGDEVAALDLVGRLLGARGRVLPMATVPLDIEAQVAGVDPADPRAIRTVRGQVAVATARGRVVNVALVPPNPPACPEAIRAIMEADWVVLGPGSWFSSVIPHLLVPELARALVDTPARRLVALNLAPQPGETSDFSPENHLEALLAHAPALHVDVVLADPTTVADRAALQSVVASLGAELVVAPVAMDDGSPRHDPAKLAATYARIFDSPARPAAGAAAAGREERTESSWQ
ncbi:MAG: uridine diphosphate-N-acetylglucosamine-binding protein YvcK [Acidothermus sp.]|nr:uridine diphosphate-N-acetylglucosamine-binding protein YvcK [Acidothermus sp.]MCL6538794.1 uridine diphosphate-N-acetylglucosamine-binding protein YvcK [Acidothermus sp.]